VAYSTETLYWTAVHPTIAVAQLHAPVASPSTLPPLCELLFDSSLLESAVVLRSYAASTSAVMQPPHSECDGALDVVAEGGAARVIRGCFVSLSLRHRPRSSGSGVTGTFGHEAAPGATTATTGADNTSLSSNLSFGRSPSDDVGLQNMLNQSGRTPFRAKG